MPVGVITSTTTIAATARPAPAEARWFATGLADRGPVDRAVRIRSLAQFVATFGAAVNYAVLYAQVAAFFALDGFEVWIARVVGPAAVHATVSLEAGDLVVTAKDPGAFANGWTAAYTAATKTLVIVTDDGTETYVGTDLASLLEACEASLKVTVTSGGALPAGNVAATALATGADDRGSITATHMTDALDLFDAELGRGAVSVPGWSAGDVGAALIAHAIVNGRIVIQGVDRADSLSDANTINDALAADDTDGVNGVFWPHLPTPSGAILSPEGVIAGHRAAVIRDHGPWWPPAGGSGALGYVTGVDQTATRDEIDTAHDTHGVNVVKLVAGIPTLYGWRSASTDVANYRYLSARDTINRIRQDVEAGLEPYVYAPLTVTLVEQARGTVQGILKGLEAAGAFYPLVDDDGAVLDPGWTLAVSKSVDPDAGAGYLDVEILVRVTPGAEAIRVSITKVPLGTAL